MTRAYARRSVRRNAYLGRRSSRWEPLVTLLIITLIVACVILYTWPLLPWLLS